MGDGRHPSSPLMPPRHLFGLLVISAVWGAGFLFNQVAVKEMSSTTLVGLRMAVGAATLAPFVLLRFGPRRVWELLRRSWHKLVITALLGSAAAPILTAWAQNELESGTTAILTASSPLFAAVASLAVARHDLTTGWRLVGLLVGFTGVALLVGAQPSGSIVSAGAVVLSSLAFGLGTVLVGRWFSGTEPMLTTFALTVVSAAVLAPFDVFDPPGGMGEWKVVGSVLGLGVAVTGFGFVLYYWVVARAGASNGILVAYLVPAFALFYGAVLLDEALGATNLLGFGIVILGVALASGMLRRSRTVEAPLSP
jgi:drug/metabolite transporter (DMT)-like permease